MVYPYLGNLDRPITSYGKHLVGKAIVIGYRWARKQKLGFELSLISDLLQSICADKRRYRNREINRKKREAGIPITMGRPRKEKERSGPRKPKPPVQPLDAQLNTTAKPSREKTKRLPQLGSQGTTPAVPEVHVPRSEPEAESSTESELMRLAKKKGSIYHDF